MGVLLLLILVLFIRKMINNACVPVFVYPPLLVLSCLVIIDTSRATVANVRRFLCIVR